VVYYVTKYRMQIKVGSATDMHSLAFSVNLDGIGEPERQCQVVWYPNPDLLAAAYDSP
jgi:hypothetical protein